MELIEIRRVILTAVAADEYLVEQLVLKGGNALELIHRIGSRASIDLDFSIATDFDDPREASRRLEQSLRDRFDAGGYLVFDYTFESRPKSRERGSPWGGYTAHFKLISHRLARELGSEPGHMRRQSEAVGPSQQRRFRIEVSAFEHTEGKVEADVDHFTCYVYSLEMIAAEKLRAICQQAPEYTRRANPTARARDFYDIYSIVTEGGVSLAGESFQHLVEEMFRAKEVPLSLLGRLEHQREFHREEWASVEIAVAKRLRDFDFYFDYLVEEVRALEPLWIVDPPA